MTAAQPITPRRLRELAGIALALIAVWLVAGLFTASEFYRRSIALGGGPIEGIRNVVMFQMVQSLNWAVLTPIIIAIAERLPLRRPLLIRNTLILLGLLPVIAVARAVWGGVVLNLGEHHAVSRQMMVLSINIRTHRNLAIGALIIVATNLVMAQREAAARARRELAAQALLVHAELDGLREQMQPHFLFLTLQTIAEVVHVDPAAADDMIVGLADLLRRSLALGNEPVPLADELDFVDRNLALYQICFGGRLAVRFDADEDVLDARVPPLLVQQLVENAVVTGIAPAGGGDIEIRGWRDGERLRVTVSNGAGNGNGAGVHDDGQGLGVVGTRLEKLFGTRQSLTVTRVPDRVSVTVAMPLDLVMQTPADAEPIGFLEEM
jgi:two-component system LytT family sensor kinase